MSDSKKLVKISSSAQRIAEMQLERLLFEASIRALTLEEIKAYDLLCKNLKISQEEAREALEGEYSKAKEESKLISSSELIEIAQGKAQAEPKKDE